MWTIDDIRSQLASLINGGQYQGNGVTTFAAPNFQAPSVSGSNASFATPTADGSGFGMNLGTVGAGLQGLNSLNSLIQGNRAFGLAKDQFRFQKGLANANLNNSIKSYNNSLEDRLTSRGVVQGDDAATVQSEIERKRLSR